ncbi:hypothetical protein HELRODRAFT_174286 [Helobdella robusta]|uniref:Uncharacterized protein n=1 Tax=Helobdella robusta TaxID=6412 RepID=T1F7Y0_HELRO|nr:hypothetical protein HELRODRAFT_174286 [Helobdella robusta]ESO02853.1 hypothetical protein HELRODRAFT_174286 [Helobdella robusta]
MQFRTFMDQDREQLIVPDVRNVLQESIENLKCELDMSWLGIVKKNIEIVANEVKTVKHTLDVTKAMKKGLEQDNLTPEQRGELKSLVTETKTKGADKDNFLFKVRGPIGRRRIVEFPKKVPPLN